MGEVYRAHDARLDRIVAIKALPQEFAEDPARRARFEREAKLLASVNHPNIAAIYGLEESDDRLYLVLEFVPGETLSERLRRGPLTTQETLTVATQTASAFETAHERGVVHRDLKPANVLLSSSGVVKVLDFGIATGRRAQSPGGADATRTLSATVPGTVQGSPAYMSPEQMRGEAVDRRTDIWSFGCLLFECLSGRRAFTGASLPDLVAQVLGQEPGWSQMPASVPKPLRDLVRECLSKSLAERPGDIGTIRRELLTLSEAQTSKDGPSSSAAATTPSLAVLYFENLSNDSESEYFCAGITEDILTDLSKLKGMQVASRNAVARYRGAPVDIPRVAADLGVTAVLEGSVRRAGDRVRITAQLINPSNGFHLWAERYDRTLQDVFAVQEEIASAIATALRGALTPSESRNLRRDRPADARAYDLYLKGRERYGRYTLDGMREALALFEEAVQIDPNYAVAWAGIGDVYGQMLVMRAQDKSADEIGKEGLQAARRAIALNPNLPEGHKAEALVQLYMNAPEASMAALRRAIDVDPRFRPALVNLGMQTMALSDLAQAERLFRRAIATDPSDGSSSLWLSGLFLITGRLDEALELATAIQRKEYDSYSTPLAAIQVALVHMGRKDFGAARASLRTLPKHPREYAYADAFRTTEAAIALRAGDAEEARRLLPDVERSEVTSMDPSLLAAEVSLALGDRRGALSILGRPFARKMANTAVRIIPELRPLLGEPPFVPKRSPNVLVWPREAPPPSAEVTELFAGVRFESGMP